MASNVERLDRFLANNFFGTRKDVKKIIRSGAVEINCKVVTDCSFHLDPLKDKVCVENEPVFAREFVYLMMNKTAGYVSAKSDKRYKTVFDLLDERFRSAKEFDALHTVGRLDLDTEGLLLFTTDGSLTHFLISPKSHIDKTYLVFLKEKMTTAEKSECINRFADGIHIEGEDNEDEADCAPAKAEFIEKEKALMLADSEAALASDAHEFSLLTIHEGKYHQVKRMFCALSNKVVYLKRLSIGNLNLDPFLKPGEYRELTAEEAEFLKSCSIKKSCGTE
ncbi:rRNA pseudouridine synthase [Treponema parvum]|uniref:Pseudouridine synthase n=1 Tax=Treponema parvum TaxID=138851 RepID=A0A975IEV6_9SPIR|nr:pseudouridine synthase [Treponema parvum]QTQ14460.1 rRNA pseudouridine synthase [Treponema parvum]